MSAKDSGQNVRLLFGDGKTFGRVPLVERPPLVLPPPVRRSLAPPPAPAAPQPAPQVPYNPQFANLDTGAWYAWTPSLTPTLSVTLPGDVGIRCVWLPAPLAAVTLFRGTASSGSPLYVSSGKPESIPIPAGISELTLTDYSGVTGTTYVYVSSHDYGPFEPAASGVVWTIPQPAAPGSGVPFVNLDRFHYRILISVGGIVAQAYKRTTTSPLPTGTYTAIGAGLPAIYELDYEQAMYFVWGYDLAIIQMTGLRNYWPFSDAAFPSVDNGNPLYLANVNVANPPGANLGASSLTSDNATSMNVNSTPENYFPVATALPASPPSGWFDYTPSGSYAFELWVACAGDDLADAFFHDIFSNGTNALDGFYSPAGMTFGVYGDQFVWTICCERPGSGVNTPVECFSGTSVVAGQIYYIACSYDAVADTMTMYVDDNPPVVVNVPYPYNTFGTQGQARNINFGNTGNGEYGSFQIAKLATYLNTLTLSQVQTHYLAGTFPDNPVFQFFEIEE